MPETMLVEMTSGTDELICSLKAALESKVGAASALREYASGIEAISQHIREIADVLDMHEEPSIRVYDDGFLHLKCSENLAQKLIDAELASVPLDDDDPDEDEDFGEFVDDDLDDEDDEDDEYDEYDLEDAG